MKKWKNIYVYIAWTYGVHTKYNRGKKLLTLEISRGDVIRLD